MKAKICGITNLEDALLAANNGAWAIGFNFYKHSPRYVPLKKAREISSQLPRDIIKVGVLIDYSKEEALDVSEFLDLVQIYQQDSSSFFEKKRIILALQASSKDELPTSSILQQYGFILLDAPKQEDGLRGGTGRLANWDLAKELTRDYKLILAGGLNNLNVETAIKCVQPFAVDVASGVEERPGSKSPVEVKNFLIRCKNVK
ncbi:phosphoribosylanthranilate isomerase [Rickettsiales endosymbiont of Peranema trichophorum]|uniref:phosphoribosylanthranilate isomerase n=1 Tax=Rickettsiales endosymbiont of Peranema trichophorum TaxID=2486577 RepID=UPI001A9342DE|nr:phosphoribosylanthranilate isomerase [Rickettsiales endosymbiont of Peranema trichophorum]